jgi:hypothetical protein
MTEWDTYSFELKPGESIILGRSPDCKVPLPRASVSQEHLKLRWTGSEMQIEDLGSSNGTFRLPQESPFANASFGPKFEDLHLRLSKAEIRLSWEPLSFGDEKTSAEPTSTEVAPSTLVEKNVKKTEVGAVSLISVARDRETQPDKSNPLTPLKPVPNQNIRQVEDPPTSVPEARETSPTPSPQTSEKRSVTRNIQFHPSHRVTSSAPFHEIASWIFICGGALALLVVSIFFGRELLQGILKQPSYLLLQGGIHDVMMIFVVIFKEQIHWIAGIWIMALVFFVWVRKKMELEAPHFIRGIASFAQMMRFKNTLLLKIFFLILMGLCLGWPVVWANKYNLGRSHLKAYRSFWKVLQNPSLDASQRIVAYRELLPQLEGSSLLYKHLFFNQRIRILKDCGGVGETATWEQKRTCLLLLSAASLETLQELRPALLMEVAKRGAILLSLDGITRSLAVEGRNSTPTLFFLNSLEAVGLFQEKEDIQKIIDRSDLSDVEMINILRDLRKRIELRMQVIQVELDLPSLFYMDIPGPLESGI